MIIDQKEANQLDAAIYKRSNQIGLNERESSILHKADRASRHGESIMVRPMSSLPHAQHGVSHSSKTNLSIENVENLSGQLRKFGSSESQYVEGAAISVVDGNGFLNLVPKHSTWVTPTTRPSTVAIDTTTATGFFDSSGIYFGVKGAGGKYFSVSSSALTQNMAIKEIDVCVGGVNKKMLIVASDPY